MKTLGKCHFAWGTKRQKGGGQILEKKKEKGLGPGISPIVEFIVKQNQGDVGRRGWKNKVEEGTKKT